MSEIKKLKAHHLSISVEMELLGKLQPKNWKPQSTWPHFLVSLKQCPDLIEWGIRRWIVLVKGSGTCSCAELRAWYQVWRVAGVATLRVPVQSHFAWWLQSADSGLRECDGRKDSEVMPGIPRARALVTSCCPPRAQVSYACQALATLCVQLIAL